MVQFVFMAIGFMVTLLNVLLWIAIRRRLKLGFPKKGNLLSIAVGIAMLIALHPGIFLMFGGVSGLMALRSTLPEWIAITGMSMQFAAWVYGGLLLIKGAPVVFYEFIRRLRRALHKPDGGTEPEKQLIDEERRSVLAKAALTFPAAIIATSIGGAMASRVEPVVTRLRMKVPRDATNLHGITIAQISDVHVGSYMDAKRLDDFIEGMNAVKADYHVMTGDLLDNHVEQLPESQRFLRSLKPRRGRVFMCMGNHEYIPARDGNIDEIINGLNESGVELLIDEARKVDIGGDHIWMAGIDYPNSPGISSSKRRTSRESLDVTLAQVKDDGAPRIVLAHHPKSFIDGREMDLDLMLSGHTHGGQIKLGRIGDFALTPVLPFEHYHNGLYSFNGRRLYVNAGAGGWMPVRINCPPEITVVELVSA